MVLLNEAGDVEGVKLQAAGSSGTLRSSMSVGVSGINELQPACSVYIDCTVHRTCDNKTTSVPT